MEQEGQGQEEEGMEQEGQGQEEGMEQESQGQEERGWSRRTGSGGVDGEGATGPDRNYPEPLSSNCLLHKEIEPSSFFSGRHV